MVIAAVRRMQSLLKVDTPWKLVVVGTVFSAPLDACLIVLCASLRKRSALIFCYNAKA
jgi:hypothetical protein